MSLCLREVVATLSLPLPSFSQWRREARPQACSFWGRSGWPPARGPRPAPLLVVRVGPVGLQCLCEPACTLTAAAGRGAMRSPARRPATGCIL